MSDAVDGLTLPLHYFNVDDPGDSPPDADAVAWELDCQLCGCGRCEYSLPTDDEGYAEYAEYFARFLETVDTTGVRELAITDWGPWGVPPDEAVRLLAEAAGRFPALRAVVVGLGDTRHVDMVVKMQQADLAPLLAAFPKLEALRVSGGWGRTPGPVRHEALRSLCVESCGMSGDLLRDLAACEFPALERLELWLGRERFGCDATVADLAPILSGERLPSLRQLALVDGEFQDEIAAAVASAPVAARLETLDLSMGTLGDEGAEALLSGQSLTHLKELRLCHHGMSDETAARVRAAVPGADLGDHPKGDLRYSAGTNDYGDCTTLPLYRFSADRASPPDAAAVAWELNCVEEENDEQGDFFAEYAAYFARFTEAVDTTRVRELVITFTDWGNSWEVATGEVVRLLVDAAGRFPALRTVALGFGDEVWNVDDLCQLPMADLTPLLTAFPALEALKASGGYALELKPVRHEALRSLCIETTGMPATVLQGLAACDLPALERLELWLGRERFGCDATVADLAPILSGERLPSLRHLALLDGEFQDEIAAAVAMAPVMARLETLDLSMGTLSEAGVEALLAGQPLTHLKELGLAVLSDYEDQWVYLEPLNAALAERVRAAIPAARLDDHPKSDMRYTLGME